MNDADPPMDEEIQKLTESIDGEVDPTKKAELYFDRGFIYLKKESYDNAIVDLTRTIKLNPENLAAYLMRGISYSDSGKTDRALADFGKAIDLAPENPRAYLWRGRVYFEKKDYDKAIKSFTRAIKLEPENSTAHLWRGQAYLGKKDYDKAIAGFTRAIELKPEDPDAYLWRGRAYLKKEDYDKAFEDFLSAGKQDSTIKLTIPLAYLASRIDDIFHQDQDAQCQKSEAFSLYEKLLDTITLIQEALFYQPETSQCEEVTHYTSLHALKKLAGKKSFRFYNVTYMNDPDEGRKFFKIMEDNEANVEEFFYEKNDQPYLSPAYIGSFTMVTPKESQKDDLFLWRTYGKHDDKEAAGACLLFKHDGSCFARRFKHQLGPIPQSLLDNESTSEPRPQAKPSLYKISYPDDKNDENDETLENLKDLAEQINLINDFNNKKQHEKKKEQLDELARNFLDTIRFLFKSDHYKAEKEVRIVEFHAYKEDEAQSSDNNIKVDVKQIPPRFYVEAPEDFCFSEVILGPRVRSSRDWKQWIEYERKNSEVSEVKVQKSIIKYGSPYS